LIGIDFPKLEGAGLPKGGARARAGRAKKPTDLKVIQGTFRNDRHGQEVKTGEAKFPKPPGFLLIDGRQKRIWKFVGEHCGPWTAPSDWPTVWGLVRLVERLIQNQEAQKETETSGHPLAFKHTLRQRPQAGGRTGDTEAMEEIEIVEAKANPLVDQEIKLFDKLRPFIAMLGLSPVDRARMPSLAGAAKPADPVDALIKRTKR
jgi:hypothetical protein